MVKTQMSCLLRRATVMMVVELPNAPHTMIPRPFIDAWKPTLDEPDMHFSTAWVHGVCLQESRRKSRN